MRAAVSLRHSRIGPGLLAGLMLLFAACTPSTPSAAAVVRVLWPQSLTQVIPVNAQSIVVTVRAVGSTAVHDTLTLNKGTTEGRVKAPVGRAVFVARAYDQPDGKGNVLAQASAEQDIVAGQSNEVRLEMTPVVTRVEVTLPQAGLEVGENVTATAVATDASGSEVPATFTWTSSNPAVATVDGSGVVRGVAPGTAQIRATENASGQQGEASLTVSETIIVIGKVDEGFDADKAAGAVVGGEVAGSDLERKLAQRNSFLVMPPLASPGWGRMSYSRGALERVTGLGAVVDLSPGDIQLPADVDEGFAVGFFASPAPTNPYANSNVLFLGYEGRGLGGYYLGVGGGARPDRVPFRHARRQIVTIANDMGAFFYAVDMQGVPGGAAYPNMRFLGASTGWSGRQMYFGLHNRGSYAHAVVVPRLKIDDSGLRNWWLSAFLAETGTGSGALGASASTGQRWNLLTGEIARTADGLKAPSSAPARAYVSVGSSTPYLLGARVKTGSTPEAVDLLVRVQDANNYHGVRFSAGGIQIYRVSSGGSPQVLAQTGHSLEPGGTHDVTVRLEGNEIQAWLDDKGPLVASDATRSSVKNVGLGFDGAGDSAISRFFAHQREVPIPANLKLEPPDAPKASTPVWTDEFSGSGSLPGRSNAGKTWEHVFGDQTFSLASGRARASSTLTDCLLQAVPHSASRVQVESTIVQLSPPGTVAFTGPAVLGGGAGSGPPGSYLVAMQFRDASQGEGSTEVEVRLKPAGESEYIWRRINMQDTLRNGTSNSTTLWTDGDWVAVWVNSEPILYHPLTSDEQRISVGRVGLYDCSVGYGKNEFENLRIY
ncbi:Ig-like domain-containing protein [Calidithermus chliarophilus]|uniref:Ig-like domain-containing protein n=1 Tax=Calidithermus chliarophilus TaxID=52023 RepID=UPI000413CC4D|nr:Ig-like domain-containing protein [Calidithermus chliarophilus]